MKRIFVLMLCVVMLAGTASAFVDWQDSIASYWAMDEGAGTNVIDSVDGLINLTTNTSALWTTGIISNAINTSIGFASALSSDPAFNLSGNATISLWVKRETSSSNDEGWIKKRNPSSPFEGWELHFEAGNILMDTIRDGGGGSGGGINASNLTGGQFNNVVVTKVFDNYTFYINGVIQGSALLEENPGGTGFGIRVGINRSLDLSKTIIDEVFIANRTFSQEEITDLFNNGAALGFGQQVSNVSLISPLDNTATLNHLINFSAEINLPNNVSNVTLFHNESGSFIFNQSNTTIGAGVNSTTVTFQGNFGNTSIIWNIQACDDTGACAFAPANFTLTTGDIVVVSETFDASTVEGSIETFSATIDSLFALSTANLIYNGTTFAASITVVDSNTSTISSTIQIPAVSSDQNLTFFWEIETTSGIDFNSSAQTQLVNNLAIDDCSVFSTLILNLTLVDEDTQIVLNGTVQNTTVEVDVDLFTIDRSGQVLNFSENFTQNVNPLICIDDDLSTSEFSMDVLIRYDADDYVSEFYNIQNFTLTNSTIPQEVTLFDLLISRATEFLITFKDVTFLPVDDALIQITRKYISEGIFKTVEIPKTDANGQAVGQFLLTEAIYTILVTKNGAILATFDNIAVVCDDEVIGDCKINLNAFSSGTKVEDWTTQGNLTFLTSFDKDSRTVTTTFTTTDGSTKNVLLNTTKYDRFGNETVCFDSLISASGTLTCVVPQSFGNVTVVSKLFSDGGLVTTAFFDLTQDPEEIFGGTRVILVLVILLTIPLMFTASTIGVILGTIIGLVMSSMLVLISGGGVFAISSTIMWLIVAGGILIWKINDKGGT